MISFKKSYVLLVSASCLSMIQPAFANESQQIELATPQNSVDQGSGGDILVTAQRRETKLQETPASIEVLSDKTLQDSAIFGLNDLTRVSPSLSVTDQGAGQRRVSIRGIRSPGEPQVALYYDEAPFVGGPGTTSDSGGNMGDLQLFDVERIEVLRGPQGTLYGASSMGGALRVIYSKPADKFEGAIDLVGSRTAYAGNNYQINAMINVPIAGELLSARAVYFRRKNAGWIDNVILGQQKLNQDEAEGARLMLRSKPAWWLTLDFALHYYDSKGANPLWAPASGRYVSIARTPLTFKDENRLYTGTADVDLGFADLVASGSYQDRDSDFIRDPYFLFEGARTNPAFCRRHFSAATCATPAGMAAFNNYVSSVTPLGYVSDQAMENLTAEARLQSKPNDVLTWAIGAFWTRRTSPVATNGTLVDGRGNLRLNEPFVYSRNIVDRLKQTALFGEVSVTPLSAITLTAGLRYYNYDRQIDSETQKGFDLIGFAVSPLTTRKTSERGALYKFNVAYKPTSELMVYAQAASGFRPGGANQVVGLPDALTPYEADSIWTYEAGVKSTLLNGALILNTTGYLTKWSDMQVNANTGLVLFLTNAGSAEVKGLEIEAVAKPLRGLQLTGSLNLLSAKLTEDQISGFALASGRKGDRIPHIPEVSYTMTSQYEWGIGNGLDAMIRAEVNYVGRSYADFRPGSIGYLNVGKYTVVGARAGVSGENWGAYLFVTNLFDEIARTTAINMIGSNVETITTVPPRTVGVNLRTNF